jgi:hypothetical protein
MVLYDDVDIMDRETLFSRGEGLLDPCQLFLGAIQARMHGTHLGGALLGMPLRRR